MISLVVCINRFYLYAGDLLYDTRESACICLTITDSKLQDTMDLMVGSN